MFNWCASTSAANYFASRPMTTHHRLSIIIEIRTTGQTTVQSGTSSSYFWLTYFSPITYFSFDSPLCSCITPSLFYPRLQPTCFTNHFPHSFTSSRWTALTDYHPDGFFWATWFLFLVFTFLVPCARLSWPSRHLLSAHKYTVSYRIVCVGCEKV